MSEVTGGEFLAIIQMETSSDKEKQDLATNISAGGMFWNADASFDSSFDSAKFKAVTSIDIYRNGTTEALPSMKELKKAALEFSTKVKIDGGEPRTILVSTIPFTSVPLKDDFPFADVLQPKQYLEDLANWRSDALLLAQNYSFAANHSWQFTGLTTQQALDAKKLCESKIKDIDEMARQVLERPFRQTYPGKSFAIQPPIPLARKYPDSVALTLAIFGPNGQAVGGAGERVELYDGFKALPISGFSVRLDMQLPGLSLEYLCNFDDQSSSGWIAAPGNTSETTQKLLSSVAFKLTGALTSIYSVYYAISTALSFPVWGALPVIPAANDIAQGSDGELVMAPAMSLISGIRLLIKPR